MIDDSGKEYKQCCTPSTWYEIIEVNGVKTFYCCVCGKCYAKINNKWVSGAWVAGEFHINEGNQKLQGHEVIERTVKPHSTSAHVGLPKSWIGCRVAVVRLDGGSE